MLTDRHNTPTIPYIMAPLLLFITQECIHSNLRLSREKEVIEKKITFFIFYAIK